MIIGCYVLDLYCDNDESIHPHLHDYSLPDLSRDTYTGYDRADCISQARKDGWVISGKRQICPYCKEKN